MVTATFRFYEELNDFLAPERRRREFACACARAATAKHMIEALGVPGAGLPVHIFVSPAGKVRCVRASELGDADYPAVEALLRGR